MDVIKTSLTDHLSSCQGIWVMSLSDYFEWLLTDQWLDCRPTLRLIHEHIAVTVDFETLTLL